MHAQILHILKASNFVLGLILLGNYEFNEYKRHIYLLLTSAQLSTGYVVARAELS